MSVAKKLQNKGINPFIETRNLNRFVEGDKNIYEMLNVISKRSNQIGQALKEELHRKLKDFTPTSDSLDEISEDLDTIEISRYYEKIPHATLISVHEFLNNEIYYRNPNAEKEEEL
jgi:DNA-directed RNA polymerase subunit K/omega